MSSHRALAPVATITVSACAPRPRPQAKRLRPQIGPDDVDEVQRGPEALGLGPKVLHELGPHDAVGEAGIVLDLRRQHQLTPYWPPAKTTVEVRTCGVDCRGQTGRTGTDDREGSVGSRHAPYEHQPRPRGLGHFRIRKGFVRMPRLRGKWTVCWKTISATFSKGTTRNRPRHPDVGRANRADSGCHQLLVRRLRGAGRGRSRTLPGCWARPGQTRRCGPAPLDPTIPLPSDVRHHPHDPHPSNGYLFFLEDGRRQR